MVKMRTKGHVNENGFYIPEDDVLLLIEDFLGEMRDALSSREETFYRCRVCDVVDGHAPGCFVPAIRRWQEVP